MSEIIVNQVDADIHHASKWPPDLDPEGLLIIGGWVDELTRVHSRNSTYSFLHFIAYSDMIGESQIGVVTYTSTSHPWGKESLPPDTNLGGSPSSAIFDQPSRPVIPTQFSLLRNQVEAVDRRSDVFERRLCPTRSLPREHVAWSLASE